MEEKPPVSVAEVRAMSEQDELVAQVGIPLTGVKEYVEGLDVELVSGPQTGGRLAIRALNECGNNETIVDLWDLVDWLRRNELLRDE